jgi:hypothetical protein
MEDINCVAIKAKEHQYGATQEPRQDIALGEIERKKENPCEKKGQK